MTPTTTDDEVEQALHVLRTNLAAATTHPHLMEDLIRRGPSIIPILDRAYAAGRPDVVRERPAIWIRILIVCGVIPALGCLVLIKHLPITVTMAIAYIYVMWAVTRFQGRTRLRSSIIEILAAMDAPEAFPTLLNAAPGGGSALKAREAIERIADRVTPAHVWGLTAAQAEALAIHLAYICEEKPSLAKRLLLLLKIADRPRARKLIVQLLANRRSALHSAARSNYYSGSSRPVKPVAEEFYAYAHELLDIIDADMAAMRLSDRLLRPSEAGADHELLRAAAFSTDASGALLLRADSTDATGATPASRLE